MNMEAGCPSLTCLSVPSLPRACWAQPLAQASWAVLTASWLHVASDASLALQTEVQLWRVRCKRRSCGVPIAPWRSATCWGWSRFAGRLWAQASCASRRLSCAQGRIPRKPSCKSPSGNARFRCEARCHRWIGLLCFGCIILPNCPAVLTFEVAFAEINTGSSRSWP